MQVLNLKSNHKPIREYYKTLQQLDKLGVSHELGVKGTFEDILKSCCGQLGWNYIAEQTLRINNTNIRPDGVIIRQDTLKHGYWEAKDNKDDLEREIKLKYSKGYPKNNILFWQPKRIILYQNNKLVFDEKIDNAENLVQAVKLFFEHTQPEIEAWDQAVVEFGDKVKELANGLLELIANQKKTNKRFIDAFSNFIALCKEAINPSLSESAVEEMLIQHLLTERIFRKLFNNPDFVKRNVIAVEIEKVIDALTSKSFNRDHFLQGVDYFYKALENAAATITEYSEKQDFLNRVYEKFFQGFAVKVADTHGIVYTPQPIVDFMVKSVDAILQKEFGKSLSDKGVHILDPFVGTGNFIMRVMKEMRKTALPYKYEHELHCNEVMLLPYYLAAMNIEHEYFTATGEYKPFEGICFVDTFEIQKQKQLDLFTPENTARVKRQQESPIYVIMGNPPYNAYQVNENDNNKNRKYEEVDNRVKETYSKDSKATLKNALSDPYVKAIRWASDRIKEEGIIVFVSNNSFISDIPFDGMRKHLSKDFNTIYILDLKGNVRKDSMGDGIPIGEKHTVFGLAAMVGISITFLVKHKDNKEHNIFYSEVDWKATRHEKFALLEQINNSFNLEWKLIKPDSKYNWLTEGLQEDFETFLPMGSKESKSSKTQDVKVIFKMYSTGMMTGRDAWVYNFNEDELSDNIQRMIETFNEQARKWNQRKNTALTIDEFVNHDEILISWSSTLKNHLNRNTIIEYNQNHIRKSIYRPFASCFLYFDSCLNDRRGQFSYMFPTQEIEKENLYIAVTNHSQVPFIVQISNFIPDVALGGRMTQCFPFYTYDKEGSNRQENITDWALTQYQNHYQDIKITKWDIFYYIYAILHHPMYRNRYEANLKKELPRIPFAPKFTPFAVAGKQLADLHLNYENQPEYPLKFIENNDLPLNWRVEKMRLSKNKTQLIYNEFLTLSGIPQEVFTYKLGNRSALDWIIDQYQIKTDKRSGIVNDPNRLDDEQYIVRLIGQIITVSLETMKIVNSLPDFR